MRFINVTEDLPRLNQPKSCYLGIGLEDDYLTLFEEPFVEESINNIGAETPCCFTDLINQTLASQKRFEVCTRDRDTPRGKLNASVCLSVGRFRGFNKPSE